MGIPTNGAIQKELTCGSARDLECRETQQICRFGEIETTMNSRAWLRSERAGGSFQTALKRMVSAVMPGPNAIAQPR
jgi:hypothetical protein